MSMYQYRRLGMVLLNTVAGLGHHPGEVTYDAIGPAALLGVSRYTVDGVHTLG